MRVAAEKSFGVLVPKGSDGVQVEGSGNTSLIVRLGVAGGSLVVLDMCGYRTSYLRDLKLGGSAGVQSAKKPQQQQQKQQAGTNPAELAITRLIQFLEQAGRMQSEGDKVAGIYRKVLGNRRLTLVLEVSSELQLAQIQPVLNMVEK